MGINLSANRKSSITITGDAEIIKNLKMNSDKVIAAAIDAVNNGLVILEKSMKKDCPVNSDPNDEDTIHLKESIHIIQPAKKYKKVIVGKVGPSKKTALNVEFGTSKMSPRIFMRTQLYKNTSDIRKAAKEIIMGGLGL